MNLTQLRSLAAHCGTPYMPVFAYLHVYSTPTGNRLQVGNGRYTVDAPTDLPPMTVDAGRLLAALSACDNDTVLSVTESNVLVRGGRVKARIPLVAANYPVSTPTPGLWWDKYMLEALTALQPLVAEDASRPWATSICLKGKYAYATNNVVLARYPLAAGSQSAPINVPGSVLPVILGTEGFTHVGRDSTSATFYYADGSWIKTGLISGDWPTATVDNFVGNLDDHQWLPVHESLAGVCEAAAKFSVDKFPVLEFGTHLLVGAFTDETQEVGRVASVDGSFVADDLGELPDSGRVNARMAGLVFAMAEGVQWHVPKRDMHVFKAGLMVGVFAGTR